MEVGIDIVDIRRIKEIWNKHGKRFLDKIFSSEEIEILKRKKQVHEAIAGRFAAKEAFMKAKGKFLSWKDIKVLQFMGRPYIDFHGRVYKGLSISHERDYAIAMVVIDENNE